MAQKKLILDYVYDHEAARSDQIYLTQPLGGGQVADFTWGQTLDQSRRMAAYLQGRGFEPGARIAILSKNCAHFFMAELAIWMAGYTTVAIFPTETAETVRFVLEHSGASLLFVGKLDAWEQQVPGVPGGLPCVAFPLAPRTDFDTWDSITARTAPLTGRLARRPDDLAMLIYTSGSTGQPKGVMHSFERITAASEGIVADVQSRIGADADNRVLSYLPLAHVFERAWVECASMVDGKTHVFFAESLDTFVQDLQRARPTIFFSVPRLWVKFQQGVHAKLPEHKLQRLLRIPLLGRLVRRKILKGLGLDQCRLAAGGAAPMPADVLRWYRALGLDLIEVYGMTEVCGASHSTLPHGQETGSVGLPYPGFASRIDPANGEIEVHSGSLTLGYYLQPELTAELMTADGWLRTGDKGEIKAAGVLHITGRVKDLFKTSKGKYVAPAPIEELLGQHPDIEACCVSGAHFAQPFALLLLSAAAMARGAAQRLELQQALQAHLQTVNAQLEAHEKLDFLAVVTGTWSPENGLVTPTLKVKRPRIEEVYGPHYAAWQAQHQPVVWAQAD